MHYDPHTGEFTWKVKIGNVVPGRRAGRINKGYVGIQIDHVKYAAHRLAFLYMTGEMPKQFVDHINTNKSDNRFANLRLANRSQNTTNYGLRRSNKSGYKGVSWNEKKRKWISRVTFNGKVYQSGSYKTPKEAYQAYLSKAKELHGEFFHP